MSHLVSLLFRILLTHLSLLLLLLFNYLVLYLFFVNNIINGHINNNINSHINNNVKNVKEMSKKMLYYSHLFLTDTVSRPRQVNK